MKSIPVMFCLLAVVIFCALLFDAESAFGIILHPGGEPDAGWVDRPSDNVVGRWGSSASCVAIGPNYILTTRHQGGDINTPVIITGVSYTIEQIWTDPANPQADIRVVKLHSANLSEYVDLYSLDIDPDELDQAIVMGGYGDGRGALLQTGGITYGYAWDEAANTTLRWGTNNIDNTQDNLNSSGYTSDVIIAYFHGPVGFEAAVANHDSGGGWFIEVDDIWKVAGISRGAEHAETDETWFRSNITPSQSAHPDYNDAVRVSSYVEWIESIVSDVCVTQVWSDFNGNCSVDIFDLADFAWQWLRNDCGPGNNFCEGADVEPDGDVDFGEFAAFSGDWGRGD